VYILARPPLPKMVSCLIVSSKRAGILITYNLNVIPAIATSSNYTTYTYTDASNNTYKVYSFMHSGTSETQTSYNIDIPQSTTMDILLVGGGGAGGTYIGGGGGAGGVLYITNAVIPIGNHTISVGKGGDSVIGNVASTTINNGISSKAFGIEVYGGTTGADGSVGDLAFLNSYATGADKRIAIIRGLRTNDNKCSILSNKGIIYS
jgi:hypothetical protein